MAQAAQSEIQDTRSLPRVSANDPFDVILDTLQEQGVVVVEDALDAEILNKIRAECEPWLERTPAGEGTFYGRKTRRFGGIFAKAPSTAALALHPSTLDVIEAALKGPFDKPYCDAIELNLTQMIAIEPGEPQQILHRDDDLWLFERDHQVTVNVMWLLDDFTYENGATRLIPGSHMWKRDRRAEPGQSIVAEAKAGSAIMWFGATLHGGGENKTDKMRRGIIVSYRLGWLAPAEKLLLSVPPEVARTLPHRLQRLLGYQLHRPSLGYVENQDPIKWLHGEVKDVAPAADNFTPKLEQIVEMATQDHSLSPGSWDD